MPKANVYLSFDGTAADAMRFYETALDGKLQMLIRFGDLQNAGEIPPGSAEKVMHSELSLKDGGVLQGSDAIGGHEGMRGFSVALTYDAAEEARRAFEALAAGGVVVLPVQPSFFAEAFGMLVDRFGTPWAISGGIVRR